MTLENGGYPIFNYEYFDLSPKALAAIKKIEKRHLDDINNLSSTFLVKNYHLDRRTANEIKAFFDELR